MPHLNDTFKHHVKSVSGCPLGGNRGPNIAKLLSAPSYIKYDKINTNVDKNTFFFSFNFSQNLRTFWLTGSSSSRPGWILSWGSYANFLQRRNLLGKDGCNHKMRRPKKVKHLYEISSSLFLKMHILKVMRFCCGKQPGGMLVFAFVE